MRTFALALLLLSLCHACLHAADDPSVLRQEGMRLLAAAAPDNAGLVQAALKFNAAAAIYAQRKDSLNLGELQSCLYWCWKKMSLPEIQLFLHSPQVGDGAIRMADVVKDAPADAAKEYLDRADKFAATYPDEKLAISMRYFEVADRFAGTPAGLEANRKSLEAQAAASAPAKKSEPPAAPEKSPPPTPPQDAAAARKPVPGAQALQAAQRSLQTIFGADYARPKPEDRLALAWKLYNGATDIADPAEQYLFHRDAVAFASKSGDLALTLAALNRFVALYQVDEKSERRAALKACATAARTGEVSRAATAFAALVDNPADQSANAIAGKFLCFALERWGEGVPMLAKSADAALKDVAAKDTAALYDDKAALAAGDAWWDLAGRESAKSARNAMFARARAFYARAISSAPAAVQLKLEKRLIVDILANIPAQNLPPNYELRSGRLYIENLKEAHGGVAFDLSPPAEYDLKVAFARVADNPKRAASDIGVEFPVDGIGRIFLIRRSEDGASVSLGIRATKEIDAIGKFGQTPGSIVFPNKIDKDQQCVLVLRVRPGRVQIFLDGNSVLNVIDFADAAQTSSKGFQFWTWNTALSITKAEYIVRAPGPDEEIPHKVNKKL